MNQLVHTPHLIQRLEALQLQRQGVCTDSRLIQAGMVFLAYRGEHADGRAFIAQAIERGACCVLWDDEGDFVWQKDWLVDNAVIPNLRGYVSEVASWFYDDPSNVLNVIGVTGTNGKTSISQWIAQALDALGQHCAIMGTVGNGFWGALETASLTTPDAANIQRLLRQFKDTNASAVAMEVSSHGLSQHRVTGVAFDGAIFTNLTRDHLDYHGSFEAYGQAKMQLFLMPGLRYAVINIDDDFGREMVQQLRTQRPDLTVYTYGFATDADVLIHDFHASLQGMKVAFRTPWGSCALQTALLGRFNAQNLAATLAVLCAQGFSVADAASVLPKLKPAIGRMDCLIEEGKPLVVVDYAHTPDALEKALTTLQEIKTEGSRLWCVFGCGGNRDKGKRLLMGAAASQFADCVVVTSDNPRLEDPQAIIEDILPAVPLATLVEVNREQAIIEAIRRSGCRDIVLIAGKGHETYQDIGGHKQHFSDFEIARQALMEKRP